MILSKAKPQEPTPKDGDRKVTTHFALWPKEVKEGVIFLERYERHYLYRTRFRVHQIGYYLITVEAPAWDIIEEKRIPPAQMTTKKMFWVSIKRASNCLFSRRNGYAGKIIMGYSICLRLFNRDII